MRVSSLLTILSILALLTMQSAYAADAIIVTIKGHAWQITEGKKAQLKRNQKLSDGAVVETGQKSSLELLMPDRSLVKLGANSRLEIKETLSSKGMTLLNLLYGKVRATVQKRPPGSLPNFKIRTQSATAGVRGTDFLVSASTDENKNHRGEFFCFTGALVIESSEGEHLADLPASNFLVADAIEQNGKLNLSERPQAVPLPQAAAERLQSESFLRSAEVPSSVLDGGAANRHGPGIPQTDVAGAHQSGRQRREHSDQDFNKGPGNVNLSPGAGATPGPTTSVSPGSGSGSGTVETSPTTGTGDSSPYYDWRNRR